MNNNSITNVDSLNPELADIFKKSIFILNESNEKPYYDEEADSIATKEYYKGLSFEKIDPKELFVLLNSHLTSTHTQHLEYKPALYLYNWVDLRPKSLMIQSIYSGTDVDPEALILADLRSQAAREKQMAIKGLTQNEGKDVVEDLETLKEIDDIERAFPFNCEHVVPQSWFAKKSPMKGDLHHLFSCIIKCNEFRDRYPFYDFTKFGNQIKEDCGTRDVTIGFEPNFGKGAVARATLYFILRYPDTINSDLKFDKIQMLNTLLEWHNLESPTEYEKHRNVAIQELQGNRNPLIDFPEISSKIDFFSGLD